MERILRGSINKLSDTKVEKIIKEAKMAVATGNGKSQVVGDGGGLYLQISKTGASSWLFRYMRNGKATAIGLGGYPEISLKAARRKSEVCREQLAHGKDPLGEKRTAQAFVQNEKIKASPKTFDDCASEYIADHRAEWKNEKHAQQWENTLATYASKVIGIKPVADVTVEDIKKILKPIWVEKHETATRVRGRIEAILDWATVHSYRTGDNPARWKGFLEHLLPKTTASQRAPKHHAALPYADIPSFISKLTAQEGMARWALELLILTACRTNEICHAQWTEIDWEKNLWMIPQERMKAGKAHRVPLVERSRQILQTLQPLTPGKYIFPGGVKDRPLSNMAMMMLLRRMGYKSITVHGFRSTFRDWVGETTQHEFHVAEAALAHGLADKVVAAYARGDLFEKRFALMRDWANYCLSSYMSSSCSDVKSS
jgi:integrase